MNQGAVSGAPAPIGRACPLPHFKEAGCTWAVSKPFDSEGGTIWVVDAHRDNGKRFVARSDEKLTAFLELERITHDLALLALLGDDARRTSRSRLIEED
jgi:hypothetical protein